ncbi:hypothetical protein TIFTF001_020583 [Ficus carica]|uniref:Uncharacterized protein n=1 Tax=Ficus carica TaxID=3494 RepID=A0AA88AU67_FICCA|nr:hypothetical protein TIFTF001_020583 [Ficus carica]
MCEISSLQSLWQHDGRSTNLTMRESDLIIVQRFPRIDACHPQVSPLARAVCLGNYDGFDVNRFFSNWFLDLPKIAMSAVLECREIARLRQILPHQG